MAKFVAGLIGGIGSGKSAVAAEFARRGARVITADTLGHEALRQPDIKARLISRWGPAILDERSEVSRRKVAAIVFARTPRGQEERKALEDLVFPYIRRRAAEEIAAAGNANALIVLDAAVLLEAGWDSLCNRVVYVHTPREARLRRLAEGRGWTTKEIEEREMAQLSLTDKASRAEDAVDNSGPPEALGPQVKRLLRLWGQEPIA